MNKKQITLEYKAGYNYEDTCRVVEPQGIFFMSGIWYILAWCKLRSDYRTFHLGRVIKVIPSENDFENKYPPLDEVIDSVYYSKIEIDVKIRVHRDVSRDTEVSKYVYGLYDEQSDGEYFIQKYQTYSLEVFGRWYLSFADRAEIIEPQELKTTVKALIARIKI